MLYPFVRPASLDAAVLAPYEGAHDLVVPHVTVGLAEVGGLAALRAAEREVSDLLPVDARVRAVLLLTGSPAPATWQTLITFPFPLAGA